MKDLTHYFVSPPKSSENVETSSVSTKKNVAENSSLTITETVVNNPNLNSTSETSVEKRSRVKIRISLKDSKNRSCDIISSKNDVVDKTPSPLKRRRSKKKGVTDKTEVENEVIIPSNKETDTSDHREDTPDAFKLLMTRNKAVNPSRNNSCLNNSNLASENGGEINKKEYKAKLKQSREKLVVLAERKGYSKRKHAEDEEAELIENRLKKRAKLFRRNEQNGKEGTGKKMKKDRGVKNVEEEHQNSNSCDNLDNNNLRNNSQKNRGSKTGRNSTEDKNGDIRYSQSENFSPFGREHTPKSKTKWTMRVKLQSHLDDDDNLEIGGDHEESASDEDYIFTPKSKVKYGKKRETKEVKKPEAEKPETPISDLSLASSKHREKKSRKKLQITETKEHELDNISKNSSPVNDEEKSFQILEENFTELDNKTPTLLLEKKLAPLFMRRSKPNPAALEARRSFLQSGIPEIVKKTLNSEQKPGFNDLGISFMPFPLVSHISQSELNLETESGSSESSYKRKSDLREKASLSFDFTKFKSLPNSREKITEERGGTNTEKFVKIDKENFETVLKDVESRCSDTRTIWESVSTTATNRSSKKSPKSLKRTKKLKLQRKSDPLSTEENIEHLNPTWTCKYKPMSSSEVVGNESATSKLRGWLSSWKFPSQKDDRSSGDEFYSSDCSSSSCYENNQVAVLLGPHGSGKTASVYAIAEELGYRVLEVNASSRRTGKKILTDFQEATKSHRVKRDQSTLKKRVPQNSLILIEDVDLIFEEDEGFVSATFQLAANTRRPIVMTCKENCTHIAKMAPQQQIIHFQNATGNRVSALLELVAFAESGYRLPRSCLDILLRNGDLRQSLLQLQYLLLSGPPSISQLGPSGDLKWQDIQPLIYKPAIKSMKKNLRESRDSDSVSNQDRELVDTLAKKLDTISLISSLTDMENPASPPWRRKLNPSLSLLEDFKPYSKSDDLGSEIADWLRFSSVGKHRFASIETSFNSKSQNSIKRKVKIGIDVALSQAVQFTLEHRSKSTDYLPVIRDMCRSEEDRASINTKRGKRFHNYLHGLNLASASSNILSAASSVFKDKVT